MVVYRSRLSDSTRWQRIALRPDDIVITTPSKCGTTWLQMICALLIFQRTDLPAPLTTLSPWVDMVVRPAEEVQRVLEAQRHRRFLKTHTPPDGLPRVDGVTYLTAGRDPRDVAVSMVHHKANLDRAVIERLLSLPAGVIPSSPVEDERSLVRQWIHDPRDPSEWLDSLRGTVWHVAAAWDRRSEPGTVLVHYADLTRDLDGQMRALAGRLGIAVPEAVWPDLVRAAGFATMRERAAELVPNERLGLFRDDTRFFHSGRSGQWRTILTDEDLAAYDRRLRSLAPPDLAQWLER